MYQKISGQAGCKNLKPFPSDSVGHELNVYSSTPTYGNYGLEPAARYAKQQAEIEKKPRKPITITLPDGHVCDLSEKILLIQE